VRTRQLLLIASLSLAAFGCAQSPFDTTVTSRIGSNQQKTSGKGDNANQSASKQSNSSSQSTTNSSADATNKTATNFIKTTPTTTPAADTTPITETAPASGTTTTADDSADDTQKSDLFLYRGHGNVHQDGDNYQYTQSMSCQLFPDRLEINLINANSSESKVSDGLRKSLGKTTFTRVDRTTLTTLGSQYTDPTFLVFASRSSKAGGATFSFSSPLPVLAVPGSITRFKALDSGSLTYQAQVTFPSGAKHKVTVTIAKATNSTLPGGIQVGAAKGLYGIEMRVNIQGDSNGSLYAKFPLPAQAKYYLDLTNRKIVTFGQYSPYNDGSNQGATVAVSTLQ